MKSLTRSPRALSDRTVTLKWPVCLGATRVGGTECWHHRNKQLSDSTRLLLLLFQCFKPVSWESLTVWYHHLKYRKALTPDSRATAENSQSWEERRDFDGVWARAAQPPQPGLSARGLAQGSWHRGQEGRSQGRTRAACWPVEARVCVGIRNVQHFPRPRYLASNPFLNGKPATQERGACSLSTDAVVHSETASCRQTLNRKAL